MVESKKDLPRSDKGIIGIELNQDECISAGGKLTGKILLSLLSDYLQASLLIAKYAGLTVKDNPTDSTAKNGSNPAAHTHLW
jgi:hypothetical protein